MSSAKKKILILPSWYPTQANPIVGSFFREQAELVQDEYDIKVLFGIRDYTGYKRYYYRKISGTNDHLKKFSENELALYPPEVVNIKYTYVSSFSEADNLELMLNAYRLQLKHFIASGWKPDLIHAHATFKAGIIASTLGKEFSIPIII